MERCLTHKAEINKFIQNLKQFPLTKQQIKTLRGQALTGNLAGAQKGLERMVTKYDYNRAV